MAAIKPARGAGDPSADDPREGRLCSSSPCRAHLGTSSASLRTSWHPRARNRTRDLQAGLQSRRFRAPPHAFECGSSAPVLSGFEDCSRHRPEQVPYGAHPQAGRNNWEELAVRGTEIEQVSLDAGTSSPAEPGNWFTTGSVQRRAGLSETSCYRHQGRRRLAHRRAERLFHRPLR